MKLEEKTISSEVIYKGSIVKLNLDTAGLPNGKTASREVVNHPGGGSYQRKRITVCSSIPLSFS